MKKYPNQLLFDEEIPARAGLQDEDDDDLDTLSINDVSLKAAAPNEEKTRDNKNKILFLVGGSVVFLLLLAAVLAVVFTLRSNEDLDTGMITENFPPTAEDPKQPVEPVTQDPSYDGTFPPATQDPEQTVEPVTQDSSYDGTFPPTTQDPEQTVEPVTQDTSYDGTFPPTTQDPGQTVEPVTQDPISTMDPSSISPTTQNPTQTAEPTPMPSEVDFSIIGWESICSENTNMVYCDDGECSSSYYQGADYDGCQVRCRPDSCQTTEFVNSAVECFGSSCGYDGRFFASAVTCEANACEGATFMACSCCDGDGCPDHIPSCRKDPIGFCSSTVLGLDCLSWGNPVCWALEVEESGTIISDNDTKAAICEGNQCDESYFDSKSVLCVGDCRDSTSWASNLECHETACTSTRDRLMIVQNSTVTCLTASCQWAYFQESDVMCDTYPSCANAFFRNGRSITCTDGACLDASIVGSPVQCSNGSCAGTNIEVSNVTCSDSSCARATIDKSLVNCHGFSCVDASISRSVVTCDTDEGCYSTSFKECTCCDGPGCPEVDDDRKTLQSCKDDVEAFCATDFDGKTCAEWGNPLCKPETIDSSLVEDIPKEICEDDGSSWRPNNCRPFETFYQSEVDCLGTKSCWYTGLFSVEYATFFASRVNCAGGEACGPSTFLGCSCCEGDCNVTYEISGEEGVFGPGLAPSCTENPTAFCNSTYLGRSCASWGNPVCKGMEYPDTEPESAAIVCVDNTCRGLHVESSGVACFEQDC